MIKERRQRRILSILQVDGMIDPRDIAHAASVVSADAAE